LGVSQRWANKFSEVGIEMVGELIGKTEEELLRIEGIGSKAIEELKAGLEERGLLYILESPKEEEEPDVSKLLEMVFSPEDNDLFMSGEVPLTYSVDPDDDLMGGALPMRAGRNDVGELDELLGQIGISIEDISEGSASGDDLDE
jgi:DNA-directed RNA polymerase subunit beta'